MLRISIVLSIGAMDSGTSQYMLATHIATTSILVVLISSMYIAVATLGHTMADTLGIMVVTTVRHMDVIISECVTASIVATSDADIVVWTTDADRVTSEVATMVADVTTLGNHAEQRAMFRMEHVHAALSATTAEA